MSVVDPKKSQADKKLGFDSVPITLKVLASPANQSGADKYGAWNWLKLEDGSMSLNTYLNALERHLTLFRAGQDYTSDTNIHNLDSMIAGLAVVRDAMIFGKVNDDRVKLSPEQIEVLERLINKEEEESEDSYVNEESVGTYWSKERWHDHTLDSARYFNMTLEYLKDYPYVGRPTFSTYERKMQDLEFKKAYEQERTYCRAGRTLQES